MFEGWQFCSPFVHTDDCYFFWNLKTHIDWWEKPKKFAACLTPATHSRKKCLFMYYSLNRKCVGCHFHPVSLNPSLLPILFACLCNVWFLNLKRHCAANIGNLLLVVCKLCVNSLGFETSINDIQFLLFVSRVKKAITAWSKL